MARPAFARSSIVFTTASGVHAVPLAEFCLWAMLGFAKDASRMAREKAAHHWERYCGRELWGSTVGIAGLGSIGREVARLCRAFGIRVLADKTHVLGYRECGRRRVGAAVRVAATPRGVRYRHRLHSADPANERNDRSARDPQYEARCVVHQHRARCRRRRGGTDCRAVRRTPRRSGARCVQQGSHCRRTAPCGICRT